MHKRMSPHGDYDHMGEAINLVNNFKVEKVIFNCGEFNELEYEQYIDCSYVSICSAFPNLKSQIDSLYYEYNDLINEKRNNML